MLEAKADSQRKIRHRVLGPTEQEFEAWTWRQKGLSLSQIATRMRIGTTGQVAATIKRFEKKFARLEEMAKDARSAKNYRERNERNRQYQSDRRTRFEQGYYDGHLTTGYYKDPLNPGIPLQNEKAPVILRCFERIKSGETLVTVAKSENIQVGTLLRILKNPKYKAWNVRAGQSFKGKWKPIVPEALFDKVQQCLTIPFDRRLRPRPRFGFHYVRGRQQPVSDQKTIETIRKVHWLRLERKSRREISQQLGLGEKLVYDILRRPEYEQLVNPELWKKTRNIRAPKGKNANIGKNIRADVKTILSLGPLRTVEVANKLGWTLNNASRTLAKMQREGTIQKEPVLHGKWQLLVHS